MKTIAMIGMGAMGRRMAARVLSAGYALTVHNRTPAAADDLVAAGAHWAETPRAAATGADAVLTMVRDDEASKAVWLNPETGALLGLGQDAWAIECSTLTPKWVRELGDSVVARGARFLDAPVVGTLPHAERGALAFLTGGAVPAPLETLLLTMGGSIAGGQEPGAYGQGAALKLAVNTLFAAQVAALAEAVGVLEHCGVGRQHALEVLRQMPVMSPAMHGISALIERDAHQPLFPVELVAKDLRYQVSTAAAAGARAPTARTTEGTFSSAVAAGLGELNISGIARLFGRTRKV